MKISAFTFIKNGEILGYPFIESIKSVLPIVDEFVINVGNSEDNTLEAIKSLNEPKIRIIQSCWNDHMTNKGFVYGQQKMIAQYNCTGDWLFYVEGDEVYHENDLDYILQQMKIYEKDENVEALAMNFIHFYGNTSSYLDSPGWYRSETRIIKSSIRSYAPDGLFWLVLRTNKKGRYPNAKLIEAYCYHYGWVRPEEKMNLKSKKVSKYWKGTYKKIDYSQMDQKIIKPFIGTHPKVIRSWISSEEKLFIADPNYKITKKQKKHRFMLKIESLFKVELSKKHYKKI